MHEPLNNELFKFVSYCFIVIREHPFNLKGGGGAMVFCGKKNSVGKFH